MLNHQISLKSATFGAAVLSCSGMLAQNRPNIVVFIVDDMGLMDTTVEFDADSAGNPRHNPLNDWYHTPAMERLAEQGIRFSRFYAQSVSSPSRTSLLTGQNAARHRVTNWIDAEGDNRCKFGPYDWNWNGLTSANVTYPKILKENGYRTIHIGKAHFSNMYTDGADPRNLGFDVNIGGSAIGHPGSYHGQNGYGWIKGQRARAVPHLEKYHGTDTFLSDALTLEAKEQVKNAVDSDKPFYLNLSHYAVHAPFETDERFIDRYPADTLHRYAAPFATLIEGQDKSLGDMLDYLDSIGVAENTLVIFLGDNGSDAPLGAKFGYSSSAPFRGKKGTEFEGGMRVPFIMSWAKPDPTNKFQKMYPIANGAFQTQMATIMDIFPTILSVAGLSPMPGYVLDGSDLKILASNSSDANHRDDFLMHFPHENNGRYHTVYIKNDWKIIYYYNPEDPRHPSYSLYNLRTDPYEHSDLALTEPEKLSEMFMLMCARLNEENAAYPVDANGAMLRPIPPTNADNH